MKTMHIHIGVEDIQQSVTFYSALFGTEPTKQKVDYAQWKLADPKLNFAISTRVNQQGVDHLGIQVETETELEEMRERLKQADISLFDEGETICCYANSEKSWLQDPANLAWETYINMGEADIYAEQQPEQPSSSCATDNTLKSTCC